MKRWIALLLAVIITFSTVPTQAFVVAAEGLDGENGTEPTVTVVETEPKETEPKETEPPVTEPEETEPPVTEPEETVAPTEPEESVAPTEPEETVAPTEPEETVAPTEPEETVEPTEPEETVAPTEPEETIAPTEPEETVAPTEPEETQPVPYNQSVSLNSGYGVTMAADGGVLPEDASVRAVLKTDDAVTEILKSAQSGLQAAVVFDLYIADAEGLSIQPQGEVTVTLQVGDLLNDLTGKTVSVYHVDPENNVARKLPCQLDAQRLTVTFVTDHFSLYAVTVNLIPEMAKKEEQPASCTCADPCGDTANETCEACKDDISLCRWLPEGMTADRLAELYRLLPDADTITLETPEEERKALMDRLILLSDLLDYLWNHNMDEAIAFEDQYADLYFRAEDLNTAITGVEAIIYDAANYDVAYNANDNSNKCTITMGSGMDSVISVVRYVNGSPRTYQVVESGGKFYFTKDGGGDYIITCERNDGITQEFIKYISSNAGSSARSITVNSVNPGANNTFELFYIYNNTLPQPYATGSNSNDDYGPNGSGVGMVEVSVNTQKLMTMPNVIFGNASLNGRAINWYFTPKYDAEGNVSTAAAEAFWKDVKLCMTEDSLRELESTGLTDIFVGYVIKSQTGWFGTEYHGDGVLNKDPVLYVAELHVTDVGQSRKYFGSVVTGNGEEKKQMSDVLKLCDDYLGGNVQWEPQGSNPANRTGYFYKGNKVYSVQVSQMDNSGLVTVADTNIKYVKKTNQHYLARFNMTLTDVTSESFISVTYKDGADGTVFADVSYPAKKPTGTGATATNVPVYKDGIPTRPGYTFDGWKLGNGATLYSNDQIKEMLVTSSSEDMVFTAQWTALEYTVIWKHEDGTTLETDTKLKYGDLPAYNGAVPTKEEDAQYRYTFSGWTPAVGAITGTEQTIVYTATFQPILRSYTVTWMNGTTLLETDLNVPYGTMPAFNGDQPKKAATAQYTYSFSGWTPAVSEVTGDVIYSAQFDEQVNEYTVIWKNEDGTILETDEEVPYGTTPAYNGSEPAKAATQAHTFTFAGWTPVIHDVTGDITYTATFEAHPIPYSVTWKNHDGSVLKTDTQYYGDMPSYSGDTPVKPADAQYTYTFTGWSPAVVAVTGNAEYTAQYSETLNYYTVTWIYQDGSKREFDENVAYGSHPVFDNSATLNYDAGNYNYFFSGWTLAGDTTVYTQEQVNAMPVQGDMILTAQYNPVIKGHTVTVDVILDARLQNGAMTGGSKVSIEQMLGSDTVLYIKGNGTMSYPLEWDAQNQNYKTGLVPNATYSIYSSKDDVTPLSSYQIIVNGTDVTRPVYFYSVTYDPNGGTLNGNSDSRTTYHRGAVSVEANAPVREGYYFQGWKIVDAPAGSAFLRPGAVLTQNIDAPYTLEAQWSNAKLDLTVVVQHAHLNDPDKGQNTNIVDDMIIDLAYRANASEAYVEVTDDVAERTKTAAEWYEAGVTSNLVTTTTFDDIYTGLDDRFQYSVNVQLHGYSVISKVETYNEATNTYEVTVTLQYNPKMFTLEYHVAADASVPSELIPTAVDLKIYSWKPALNKWSPISVHNAHSLDVLFNLKDNPLTTATENGDSRYGRGTYELPVFAEEGDPFFYRTAAVGFTVFDAANEKVELTAHAVGALGNDKWQFTSDLVDGKYPAGAYTAELTFDPYENSGHIGAHGHEHGDKFEQRGVLQLLVKAHPAKILLNPKGGNFTTGAITVDQNGNGEIANVFTIPDLTDARYIPSKAGYTFRGWYLDEACTKPAVTGAFLPLDQVTTLYAKWNAHITVTGTVTVSATYTLGEGEHKTVHTIHAEDRLKHVTVRLLNEQGLPVDAATTGEIIYSGAYGTATYTIKNVPDDGTNYKVAILQSQGAFYTDTYLNEPDSLTMSTSYGNYNANKNAVVTGTVDPLTATVHSYLQFVPSNFTLNYKIDASAIGADFRPSKAESLVLYDNDVSAGFKWAVISQMVHGSENIGQTDVLASGKADGHYDVWKYHADGSLYNYALRLNKLVFGDRTVSAFAAEPYTISYDPSYTYYTLEGGEDADQVKILKLTITPKTYPVSYVLNGGAMTTDNYPTIHTWSGETALNNVVPARAGYEFGGWYTSAAFESATACTTIAAGIHEPVTLYAKWVPVVYTITYQNVYELSDTLKNPLSYTADTQTFTLDNPKKEGYTFTGWTGSNGEVPQTRVTIEKGTTGDLTFTAHWEKNTYTISVTVENGTSNPADSVISKEYGTSQEITFTKNAGFALDTVTVDGNPAVLDNNGKYTFSNIKANHTIHVLYSKDTLNDGDNKPDHYQKKVTYAAVNGEIKGTTSFVFDMKRYEGGVWVDANPTLGTTIPALEPAAGALGGKLVPDEGYTTTGRWIREITKDTPVTDDVTYTWYFTQKVLYSVTFEDADKIPAADGTLPLTITGGIPHGSQIKVDPNGGKWKTSLVNQEEKVYADAVTFEVKQNVSLDTPYRDHYVFKGWEQTAGTDGVSYIYKAKWEPVVYTIHYELHGGYPVWENLTTYDVETKSFTLVNPTRPGYDFSGWTGSNGDTPAMSVQVVTADGGNRTYTANWTARTDTSYRVEYYLEDLVWTGDEISYTLDGERSSTEAGTTDTTVEVTPEKIEGFIFDSNKSNVTGTITADRMMVLRLYYSRKTYTVKWKHLDKTELLETDTGVKYGATPVYDGAVPTKERTPQHSYSFSGWTPAIAEVTGDITYTAQFDSTVNQYTVRWEDYNGQPLEIESVAYNGNPYFDGNEPKRESDSKHHYTFKGWTLPGSPVIYTQDAANEQTVIGDMTFTAQYDASLRRYEGTVNIYVDDQPVTSAQLGSALNGMDLYLGGAESDTDVITYHKLTVKAGTQNSYWTDQLLVDRSYQLYMGTDSTEKTKVSESLILSIEAGHKSADLHFYTVTYKANAGDEDAFAVAYFQKGSAVTVQSDVPSKEGYIFRGWNQTEPAGNSATMYAGAALTGSITEKYILTAQWSQAVKVEVKVNVVHEIGNAGSANYAKDTTPGDMDIELTYRPVKPNTNEPYVEIVGAGEVTIPKATWYKTSGAESTEYTYNGFDHFDDAFEYSANVYIANYEVTAKSEEYNKQTRTYTVTVSLQYNPDMFTLTYGVTTDEDVPTHLIPKAVDVKIYKNFGNSAWEPITAHQHNAMDVVLNDSGSGSGSYNLPVVINGNTAYYRTAAVGFTVLDSAGNKVELTAPVGTLDFGETWTFTSSKVDGKYPAGAYCATLTFRAENNEHVGAHGHEEGAAYVQKGALNLVVTANPGTVILNTDGGTLTLASAETVDNKLQIKTFTVPDLTAPDYVPTKAGHTFLGWYRNNEPFADAGMVIGGTGTNATASVEYTAMWAENFNIKGTINVLHYNEDLIRANEDYLQQVTVTLNKKHNGVLVPIESELYTLKDGNANYSFENVSNAPGAEYYVTVSQIGYTVTYQNEIATDYGNQVDANKAVNHSTPNNELHVNIQLTPDKYELNFEVDSTSLGAVSRPQNIRVYVVKDINSDVTQEWKPVHMMQNTDGTENPAAAAAATYGSEEGIAEGSVEAWCYRIDGYAYNYAIRIQSMGVDLNADGNISDNEKLSATIAENYRDKYVDLPLPFWVSYRYPAYYKEDKSDQNIMLRATLIPKDYTVTVDLNGGSWAAGTSYNMAYSHTWSKPTEIILGTPNRNGYVFDGWEAVNTETNAAISGISQTETKITVGAGVYQNVTLRAKWTKIQEIIIAGDTVALTYDGKNHVYTQESDKNLILANGLPEGCTIEGLAFRVEGTNADTYHGAVYVPEGQSIVIKNGQTDVTRYYKVNYSNAEVVLVIHPASLTITAENKTHEYNGHVFEDFTYKVDGIQANDQFEELGLTVGWTGSATTKTDVGTYAIVPVISGTTLNYLVKVESGTLNITARQITTSDLELTADDKVYDDTTDVKSYQITVKDSAIATGDDIGFHVGHIAFDAAQVNRDAQQNVIDRVVTATGVTLTGADAKNYQLVQTTRQQGITLTTTAKITPAELTVTLVPVDRMYDGTKDVQINQTALVDGLFTGDDVSVHVPATGTMEDANAGQNKPVSVTEVIILSGADSGNYTVNKVEQTVNIAKRTVTLTAASAQRTFIPETPLTASEVSVTGDGFVTGDATYKTTGAWLGKIDETTSAPNPVVLTFAEGKEQNYIHNCVDGLLTVWADLNQNQKNDDEETRYTVTYKQADHSNMTSDAKHENLLTQMPIPEPPVVSVDTGYVAAENWKLIQGTEHSNGMIGTTDLVYELEVKPADYKITYVLESDAKNAEKNPETYTYLVGVPSFKEATRDGYVFMGWYADQYHTRLVTNISETEHGDKTLYPLWEEDVIVAEDIRDPHPDKPGDGIPDIYQVAITYRIVNGSWADDSVEDKTHILTHSRKNEQGEWVYAGKKLGDTVPEDMKPDVAHQPDSGQWMPEVSEETVLPQINTTYVYTYGELKEYVFTIDVENGTAKFGASVYDELVTVNVKHGDLPTFTFTPDAGYALDIARMQQTGAQSWTPIILSEDGKFTLPEPATASMTIHVVFSTDVWNEEEDDPEKSDGIPDNRQVYVRYRSYDENGQLNGPVDQIFTLEENVKTVQPQTVEAIANTGYALECWKNDDGDVVTDPFAVIDAEGGMMYTFTAYWSQDLWTDADATDADDDEDATGSTDKPESDGIADIYQAVVRYEVDGIGGSLTGNLLQVITLPVQGNDGTEITPVTVVPAPGYLFEYWKLGSTVVTDPFDTDMLESGREYLFKASFVPDMKTITYADSDKLVDDVPTPETKPIQATKQIRVDPNGGKWNGSSDVQIVTITQNTTLTDPVRTGYIFSGWECTDGPGVLDGGIDIRYTFTAQWEKDISGDGIPDKYQKKVVFRINNGVWGKTSDDVQPDWVGTDDDIIYYVTLLDENNKPSETGSADISDLIPVKMKAKSGYHKGKWDVTPPDEVEGNQSVVYTYSFKKDTTDIAETGDGIMMPVSMMCASGFGLIALLALGKRKKKETDSEQ